MWSARQERGRYELQNGIVIMQQSQNIAHLRAKGRVYLALQAAIEQAGVDFYALPDGATVRIGQRTAFEPDALVAPLPMPADDALAVVDPVLVVEVLSPTSVKRDLSDKVIGYFQVQTIAHYLVIDPIENVLIWHRRCVGGGLEPPAVLKEGVVAFDPPGIALDITVLFA